MTGSAGLARGCVPVSGVRNPLFAGNLWSTPLPHALLARQKVEGSNPFSRFREDVHLQVFFIRTVGWCVCVAGHPLGTGGAARGRSASREVNSGTFAGRLLLTRPTDLLRDARLQFFD